MIQENKSIQDNAQSLQMAVSDSYGSLKMTCEDNVELLVRTKNESIDIICIDPPYKYLKNQKLEVDFDERLFFLECARVLTKDGFIIMFGRGESFYRMNQLLSNLIEYEDNTYGYKVFDDKGKILNKLKYKDKILNFKEEIIWNKRYTSSPLNAIMRTHETVSIYSKGNGKINKIKLELTEAYKFEPEKIKETINRLKSTFGNRKTFDLVQTYFETGFTEFTEGKDRKFCTSVSSDFLKRNRTLQFAVTLQQGVTERSIFSEPREHFKAIHPTQKPVKLIERLLNLCLPNKPKEKIFVADFFGGSFSTMEAVYNLGLNGISCEIDKEYFTKGIERINNHVAQKKLF